MPSRKGSSPLQRGLACLCCRKRKLKCDGTRPVCHQCTKFNRADDCEYDDRKQKSRTQKLREKLSMLEERIRELESSPGASTSDSPLVSSSPAPSHSMVDGFDFFASTDPNSNILPSDSWISSGASTSSASSGSVSQLGGGSTPVGSSSYPADDFGFLGGNLFDTTAFTGLSSVNYPYMPRWDPKEPLPYENRKFLLDVFMYHRHQCWFDVDMARFDVSAALTPGTEPHPCLMNAIYLLGCRYSRTPYCTELESTFLTRALHEISVALDKSDRLVDVVQASCLLAVYFYTSNRTLEGYTHSFSAARLAVGLGLHQIRLNPSSGLQYPDVTPIQIPPPRDHIELRDRISTFWQVFMVDRCWSVANGLPVGLPDMSCSQTRIQTPWPSPSLGLGNSYDYQNITDINQVNEAKDMYLPALKAKAAALFERSSRLASGSTKNDDYWKEFTVTKAALDKFLASLPVFIGYEAWRTQAPYIDVDLLMIHTMVHASIIQLQQDVMDFAAQQATNSLMALIRQVSDHDYEYLDPILTFCWSILAKRLNRVLEMTSKGEYPIPWDAYTVTITEQELQLVINALTGLSYFLPVADEHVRKIKEERSNILGYVS